MSTVNVSHDVEVEDHERRNAIFDGDFFVYLPRPSMLWLCSAARDAIEKMLGAEPTWAQQRMSEAEFSVLFRGAVRDFARRRFHLVLAAAAVTELGCDPATTYVSPPELAAFTGQDFLREGVGMPRHPHRDTWYAASPSQLHWWVSLYQPDDSSTLAFHPTYWEWPITNSSAEFDFDTWRNSNEMDDAQPTAPGEPRALEAVDLAPEIRIAAPAGSLVMFSSAQLYSIVPNDSLRTYFAAHFHTINAEDLRGGAGAANVDAATDWLGVEELRPLQ